MKSDLDALDCYAYISLEEVRLYMISEGYFSDFSDNGFGVWSFKRPIPSITIISPKSDGVYNAGETLSVKATIKNVSTAKLSINFQHDVKENLDEQGEVLFDDYVISAGDMGELRIKVEASNDTAIVSKSITVHISPKLYANSGTDKDRLSHEEQLVNANYIYDSLLNYGWTREAICGLFGNIQRESHFNPGVWQRKDSNTGLGNTEMGYGLVQWTSAKDKFLEWAKLDVTAVDNMAVNDPKRLIDLQLEYLIYSSLSSTSTSSHHRQWFATTDHDSPQEMTYEQYISSTLDAEDLAYVFEGSYERSSDSLTIKQQRSDNAKRWYDYFDKGIISDNLSE